MHLTLCHWAVRRAVHRGRPRLAASLGFSELTISGLLGHWPRGVTQRYVHLDAALVIAADQVAAEIARLLDSGEVTVHEECETSQVRGKGRFAGGGLTKREMLAGSAS